MNGGQRVLWVVPSRFDVKPDKSTWLEVSSVLAANGYSVTILTGYAESKYEAASDCVAVVCFNAISLGGLFRLSLLLRILVWLVVNTRNGDIVIIPAGGLYIAPLLRLLGGRYIHLDVRTVPVDIHKLRDRIDVALFWSIPLKRLRRFADGFSFITDRLRQSVENEFNTRFEDHVIWQSGVDTRRFRPASKKNGNSSTEAFALFYHGTVTRNRGIGRVIEALAELGEPYRSNVTFVVVGAGSGQTYMMELARLKGLGNRVVFKDLLPYEDIPEEINKADCCVCPLLDLPEWGMSSPIKVFEYMASGKPMILTPIAAHTDVLAGVDSVVWTQGYEINDFRLAIATAYDKRVDLVEAARRGYEVARDHHDWRVQGRKFAQYLAGRAPPRT